MSRAARPLVYAGAFAVVLGLSKVHAAFIGHYDLTGTGRFGWTLAYAGILCLCAYGFGLPDLPRDRREGIAASVGAAFSAAVAISLVQLSLGDTLLPRFVVFGSALLLPDWYRVCVRLSSGGRKRGQERDRILLIAGNAEAAALESELGLYPEKPASIVRHLIPREVCTPAAVGAISDAASSANVLVLDREAMGHDELLAEVSKLHLAGLRVRTLTAFYGEWLGKVPLSELERAATLFDIGEIHRSGYGRAKRLFDVAIAACGLVPLLLLVLFVVPANLLGNRGPLLYRQTRVGKGGREFTMLKLRTMKPCSDDVDAHWTEADDPRITRIGRVLRLSHLDELPQVVNVLRGDLSIVGPRPEQSHYVQQLSDKLAYYQLRHSVRPGLTGWAQVKYGYASNESDALEKLQYEFWYLRNQSMRTDVRIVGRTVRALSGVAGRGR